MATPILDYQSPRHAGKGVWRRRIARVAWFIVGTALTYSAVMVIAINKPDSLRGARVGGEWFAVHENDRQLEMAAVAIVAGIVGLLLLARRPLRLPGALLLGQCFALLAAVIVLYSK